jgi:hypothetical protein
MYTTLGHPPQLSYYMKGSLNWTFAIHIESLYSIWSVNRLARLVPSIEVESRPFANAAAPVRASLVRLWLKLDDQLNLDRVIDVPVCYQDILTWDGWS